MSKSHFRRFKTLFFEEFLWRDDEAAEIDGAKLEELFNQYFQSGKYPTLDELRSTVRCVELVWDDSLKKYLERYVRYPQDFDEVTDFFEENLEGACKLALDKCRQQSQSSKRALSVKAQEEEKPLPADDPKELVQEYTELQQKIRELQSEKRKLWDERARILAPFPRLKISSEEEKSVSDAVRVRVYHPRGGVVEAEWKLPRQDMTKKEELVQKAARELSLDSFIKLRAIEKAKERLSLIESKAVIDGVTLPEVEFAVHDEEDFTSFTFRGKEYVVGVRQGKAIKLLYEAHQSGHPDVPIEKIKKEMGLPSTSDLRDSFRKAGLWNTLIDSKKRGTRRLNIPDSPRTR
ncbi:hypothetical protein MYX84_14715 [Acidobacteria bacterium AH-259-O06]|nr:hypothetical protein [Acidobacteria bacterium AH-259-O06]